MSMRMDVCMYVYVCVCKTTQPEALLCGSTWVVQCALGEIRRSPTLAGVHTYIHTYIHLSCHLYVYVYVYLYLYLWVLLESLTDQMGFWRLKSKAGSKKRARAWMCIYMFPSPPLPSLNLPRVN